MNKIIGSGRVLFTFLNFLKYFEDAHRLEMADQEQQQQLNHNQQQQQQQETDHTSERDRDAIPEAKTLTNIYYDCLDQIFDFLNFESLLNVAQTCKRLRIAAAAKFSDEFDKTRIELYLHRPDDWQSGVYWHPKCIYVVNLKFCLPFLRCFGAKISDLLVDYSGTSIEHCGYVDQYISQYCAETLTNIVFLGKPEFSIELFQKPFKNVTAAAISEASLKNQLSNFVNWLPNLRRLELIEVEILTDDETLIAMSFPHLECLSISIAPEISMGHLTYDQAMHLLNANRQLHCLKIVSFYVMDIGIIKNVNELIQFANEYPLIDDLDMRASIFKADNAIDVFRQLNSLKHFGFLVRDQFEHDRLMNQLDMKWQHYVFPIYGENDMLFYIKLSR